MLINCSFINKNVHQAVVAKRETLGKQTWTLGIVLPRSNITLPHKTIKDGNIFKVTLSIKTTTYPPRSKCVKLQFTMGLKKKKNIA